MGDLFFFLFLQTGIDEPLPPIEVGVSYQQDRKCPYVHRGLPYILNPKDWKSPSSLSKQHTRKCMGRNRPSTTFRKNDPYIRYTYRRK